MKPCGEIMCGSREGTGGLDPAPLKSQKYRVLSNTGPAPLKNHKATKPEFNVGPSSVRQRAPFKWRFAGGSMMACF